MCIEFTWQKAIHPHQNKLIDVYSLLSLIFSRIECVRKEIVYFPAEGAAGTAGEYYEGNHIASRWFVKDTVDRFSECLVCQEFWGGTAIRATGADNNKYGEVIDSKCIMCVYLYVYFVVLGSVMSLWKFVIDIRTWCKLWPRVWSKWRNREVELSNHRWNYQFNTFWIGCTCHESVFVC